MLEEEFHHKFKYSSMHGLYLLAMVHDVTSAHCTGCYKQLTVCMVFVDMKIATKSACHSHEHHQAQTHIHI